MNVSFLGSAKIESFEDKAFQCSDDVVILVKIGSFCFNYKGEEYVVEENEAAVFKRNECYNCSMILPMTLYLFRYKSDYPLFEQNKVSFRDVGRIQSTLSLLAEMDINILEDNFRHKKALFEDIVTQYSIEHNKKVENCQIKDSLVLDAVSYLNASIHKRVDLESVAERYKMNYTQFIKRFKKVTNMTPSEYITFLKIQKAKSLLAESDLLIKEIAAECGFSNEYYFSNFFKKHTAVSPLHFRKGVS